MDAKELDTAKDVGASGGKKHLGVRFRLTEAQVRRLSIATHPVSKDGRDTVAPRPADAAGPYIIKLDGTPTGFEVYVGAAGASYRIAIKGPQGFRRATIGGVHDIGLDEAMEKAREYARQIRETGDNPREIERQKRRRPSVRDITVEECVQVYIEQLAGFVKSGRRKAASVAAVQDSLARLSRPEVDLARQRIRDLQDPDIRKALDDLRLSAMRRSNRIPTPLKERLAQVPDWSRLTTAELESLGIKGKYIQRVKAAGLAAAEHTLTDAARAVNLVLTREAKHAQQEGRPAVLIHNPFNLLREDKLTRDASDLRKHYERSRARNPLASEDHSLANVLKAIVARRDEQGGNNRAGADYLLLTLLFGTRRSESARLKWFDRCTQGELNQREASWIWLAEPDAINPITGLAGSQAYFHDTKNNSDRLIPIAYFAERLLRRRMEERDEIEANAPARIKAAEDRLVAVRKQSKDTIKWAKAMKDVESEKERLARQVWVFPARSGKAQDGHYSDSKSIIANIRRDAGLYDPEQDLDIGLTPHDFRRTLGRYAEARFGGSRLVSQILHHVSKSGEQASATQLYNSQEWGRLRSAFAEVEEDMIAASPRVWNRLKGPDKPRFDEANDPPPTIFATRKQGLTDGAADTDG